MQHKAAIGLHRSAEIDGLPGEVPTGLARIEGDIHPVEQGRQAHVHRSIDDHAKRAFGVVLADVGERPGKIRIGHRRHGDEEVVGEADLVADVFAGHAPIAIGRPAKRSVTAGAVGGRGRLRVNPADQVVVALHADKRLRPGHA